MKIPPHLVRRGLVAGGLLLLLPVTCHVRQPNPAIDDVSLAGSPVVRLSLTSLKSGVPMQLAFSVPVSAQWARIRRSLGDLGYIVLAVDPQRDGIIPFGTLNLDVQVSARHAKLPLEPARDPPYGYSSTSDFGLQFKPQVGDELTVIITAQRPELLPAGELVVAPYWAGSMKDHMIEAHVETEIAPYVTWGAAAVGLALLVVSGVLGAVRPS